MSQLTLYVNQTLAVCVLPNLEHEFIMTSKEVALGYDVAEKTIRNNVSVHSDELIEGKHFVKGARISGTLVGTNLQPHQTFWTKRGIVRLGFFIKSEKAKQFRDWAEDLIIYAQETNVYERLAQLEARINQLQIQLPYTTAPSYETVKESLIEYFNKYLKWGDMGRVARANGYSYRYVQRVKLGHAPNKKIRQLLFQQCIDNQNGVTADYNLFN